MPEKNMNIVVSIKVDNTDQSMIDFWNEIDNLLMSSAEEALGLESGSGSVEKDTVVSLVMGDTQTTVTANFSFAGQWLKNT